MDIRKKKLLKIELKLSYLTKKYKVITFYDLEKYFTPEEIEIIKNKIIYKKTSINIIEEAENIINETPYTILNIDEKEYTKSEMLEILKRRINEIKSKKINKTTKEIEINKALDSYNLILKRN